MENQVGVEIEVEPFAQVNLAHLAKGTRQYAEFVNPQWVKLLSALAMNKNFVNCTGSELRTDTGEVYIDFLSGYGVYNMGHNHPSIIKALVEQLQSGAPSMLQSHVPKLAGLLAERLCKLAGGNLERCVFTNTGSEGVETAIKFSRAFTRRDKIVYAQGGFHGLTYGALSLMSNPWWREGFGSVLPNTVAVPFGDLEALQVALARGDVAALILEPIQGEQGVLVPAPEYLKEAQKLCQYHGTLFVLDEVQTGIYRTGQFLAAQHFNVQPDMVILAKALSGGLVPVGALLMRTDVCDSVFASVDKAFVHASTFGENALSMRAGLATLDVMEQEKLGQSSQELGKKFRAELSRLVGKYEMVKEVRGVGLFNAIQFQSPSSLTLKALYKTFTAAHAGLFGQMLVMMMFDQHRYLVQMAGNNFLAIKTIPALNIPEKYLVGFVDALDAVLNAVENNKTKFWTQGLQIAARALR